MVVDLFQGTMYLRIFLWMLLGDWILGGCTLRRRRGFGLRLALIVLAGGALTQLAHMKLYPREVISLADSALRAAVILIPCLASVAAITICFEAKPQTAIFLTSTGLATQNLAGNLVSLLVIGLGAESPTARFLLELGGYTVVYLTLSFVITPYLHEWQFHVDNRQKLIFAFVGFAITIGMARLSRDNPGRNTMSIVSETLFQSFCDLFILIVQYGVMERTRLRQNVELMRELEHERWEQYRMSRESMNLVNEKYHDLKNIIGTLRQEMPKTSLDQLERSVDEYDVQVRTGSEVLDVLLAEKRSRCIPYHIQLSCFVGGINFSFLDKMDLYTLFNNALNNAIEANLRLPADAERFINLSARMEGNVLSVHVENPFTGSLEMDNGLPKSQRDARHHGFGMRSMERTAAKYDGFLTVKAVDGMFYLDCILCAPMEKSVM